jgi:diguanylate cyclase (GGDEF)-like protein
MDKDHQQTKTEWKEIQESLANQSGLAVVVADDSEVISASNNNSICDNLYFSEGFASQCAEFCGKAFEQANAEGKTISVKCHAGIHYYAVPLKPKGDKPLVAIVGRSFLNSEDYRKATARAIEGDWREFSSEKLFENVILSTSEHEITKLSKRLEKLSREEMESLAEAGQPKIVREPDGRVDIQRNGEISHLIEKFQKNQAPLDKVKATTNDQPLEKIEELSAWRSLFSSLLEMEYKDVFVSVARFLTERYRISNIAWLENRENVLESIWGTGSFRGEHIQISISAADARFLEVVRNETSLELRERNPGTKDTASSVSINLFPIAIGDMIRSALVIGDDISGRNIKKQISRLIKHVASEIEILRLREEIKHQTWLTKAVKKLNQTLKKIDNEDFWLVLAQNAAELMRAERGSILIYDEVSEGFIVKAAVGSRADIIKMAASKTLGERVAQSVLKSGRPLIVRDAKKAGFPALPPDWKYRTDSFISYPIVISGRKIGVLNLTDKIDGGFYDERDLEILHTLAPQIALALDRISLMQRAGEFEQLSITDPLTGLVNRRYLEERLTEEINRSQRHGYPLSFMMIDVDAFKSYNDNFGHTEGDKALQLVGQCLKSALRGADVAARYGGEEFSILLPQTTLREAVLIAERIRTKVEKTNFSNRQVTISLGIATCSNIIKTVPALIKAADKALYQAKTAGRNNVQVFEG